jgi:hypothetical protein
VYPAWWRQLVDGGLVELPLRLGDGVQPVTTFRKDGARLHSIGVVPGGFMTLRDPAGGSLTVEEEVVSVSGAGVGLSAWGGAVRGMSAGARRKLLRLLLGEPRARSAVADLPYWSLGLYLSLTVPASRFLSTWPAGVGVAARDGRSAAVVVAADARDGGRARTHELRAYGEPAAEEDLRHRLEHWLALGCPGEDELRLTVEFADGAPRLRRRWRRGPAAR